jgi:predicted acylesterase/phospholipase RssA
MNPNNGDTTSESGPAGRQGEPGSHSGAGHTDEAVKTAVAKLEAAIEQFLADMPGAAARLGPLAEKIRATQAVISKQAPEPHPRRAICLGGGGPAVGLHIGALERLKSLGVDFGDKHSIWALSCIGAWVGVIYNQAKEGKEIEETYKFFRNVFRDNRSFESFPTNTIFAPDWAGNAEAMLDFMLEPRNYRNAFLPREIMRSFVDTLAVIRRPKEWRKFGEGDFNRWTLNNVLAIHPAVRFLTGMMYKSKIDGLARLYYEDSKFLRDIRFDKLKNEEKPFIFYNAFNFKKKNIDLFANRLSSGNFKADKMISAASLCACSALPYVEKTVEVEGEVYCEGALVDTVNFKHLISDAHIAESDPVKEIWINRIVDVRQIRQPRNVYDALANLCQMFAATVGEDDVKLFKFHVREQNRIRQSKKHKLWEGTIIDMNVDDHIDFHWSRDNLDRGRANGARTAEYAYKLYTWYGGRKGVDGVFIIPDDLEDHEILAAGVPLPRKRRRQRGEETK